ncbi:MAG: cytochrome c biogenesis protein ResB [Desulfobulbaceae bacterium]|nr:cytochrome c biogenesis protein ResB [Desulfobulbaceae bacterium]
MTTQKKNPFWALFSSVKLALFLLFILAATSIIGTVVQQNKPPQFYVEVYGPNLARLMQTLSIPDMYNSWWFMILLALFSLNLIVCSLERIPNAWRLVTMDNLATAPERLQKMGMRKAVPVQGTVSESVEKTASFLADKGWKTDRRDLENGTLLFSQKGGWTRFGVYVVHSSILIILLGAIIGSPRLANSLLGNPLFAFKGGVNIPETQQTDVIYSFLTQKPLPLGFTVRCDSFDIHYYPNGMVKDYVSILTVLENGQEVLTKKVVVNEPLIYNGITFYQSSYQPYQDFILTVKSEETGLTTTDLVPYAKQVTWKEGGARFGIINMERRGEAVSRFKIWFTDDQGEPAKFWLQPGRKAVIERPSGTYTLSAKQLYATGLQVAKDPGVWWVYIGCGLMLVGLVIAFFMSHRKIWALIREEDGKVTVLFAGSANKNKLGFEKTFTDLVEGME